jgi:protein SMG7
VRRLNVDGRPKLSAQEYVAVFLKLHGLLHAAAALDTAEKCVKLLTTTLTAHIATESLTSWKLVQVRKLTPGTCTRLKSPRNATRIYLP